MQIIQKEGYGLPHLTFWMRLNYWILLIFIDFFNYLTVFKLWDTVLFYAKIIKY